METSDSKLYRDAHKTLAKYCKERWGYARSRVYQLIEAARVIENVHYGGQTECESLPNTERQIHPLASLPADQQANAWADTVDRCQERGEHITAYQLIKAPEMFDNPKHSCKINRSFGRIGKPI